MSNKYFIIYRTTNIITGEYYIGKHETYDLGDTYLGSGKILREKLKEYGKHNFVRDILYYLPNKIALNAKERELVNFDILRDPLCMNRTLGGLGTWEYMNSVTGSPIMRDKEIHAMGLATHLHKLNSDPEYKKRWKENLVKGFMNSEKWRVAMKNMNRDWWTGKHHSDETKKKISDKNKISSAGSRNSQYGTCWITKDNLNKKIKKEDLQTWIDQGWSKGRKV